MIKNLLLRVINWMNNDPSYYARVDNIKVYSREFLESVNPKDTIAKFLGDMDKMDRCMQSGENCVIKGVIVYNDVDLTQEIDL